MTEGADVVPAFSLGIHADTVRSFLDDVGVARIVGYRRSGKSTLAEMLVGEFRAEGAHVLHQQASSWLVQRPYSVDAPSCDPTVDLEISQALRHIDAHQHERVIWVVDDADVLTSYASDDALSAIGRRLRAGLFSVILIRNRYLREDSWFAHRETILHPTMPTTLLEALSGTAAYDACSTVVRGSDAPERARWLTRYSGGVPGLIAEFGRMFPLSGWRPEQLEMQLVDRALGERRRLNLDAPARAALLAALRDRALPPPSFLNEEFAYEIGGMVVSGMVHSTYWCSTSPFRGDFWSLVGGDARVPGSAEPFLHDDEEIALTLEMLISEAGLGSAMTAALDLGVDTGGLLALTFAQCLQCSRKLPQVAIRLDEILAAYLGVGNLLLLLKQAGVSAPAEETPEPKALARLLIQGASHA